MGMSTGGNKKGGISEINITPLVDVVLVLLIIFIVIAQDLQQGVAVTLPEVPKRSDKKEDKEDKNVLVSIKKEKTTGVVRVFIEKEEIKERDKFVPQLRAEMQKPKNRGKKVEIKGDVEVPYGEVRRLMRDCQEAGQYGVSLAVKEDNSN
jgi:biopolymer transport protein ExbD/biopolymer transport protein TolR